MNNDGGCAHRLIAGCDWFVSRRALAGHNDRQSQQKRSEIAGTPCIQFRRSAMDVIDPHNAQEIFFDGIHEVKIVAGIVRIVLYSRQNDVGTVVARLALPLSELPDVIQALVIALTNAAKTASP
jgi:hypothetical protein